MTAKAGKRLDRRVALSIGYYPDEEEARKAEQKWVAPAWSEAELHRMIDDAGSSQKQLAQSPSLIVAMI